MTPRDAPEPDPPGPDAPEPDAPRAAWLDAAMEILVERGVGQVKVLALSARLGVSRSSFYWRFRNRAALLDELLTEWEARNTAGLLAQCAAPAETATGAICNVFRCFFDPGLFDHRLDFAVRDWARRDAAVKAKVDQADAARLEGVRALFLRHGYAPEDAAVRARVVYLMQLGYYAIDVAEPLEARLATVPFYLETFAGRAPRPEEVAELAAFARRVSAAGAGAAR